MKKAFCHGLKTTSLILCSSTYKDDFRSVLRTLESLFAIFVLIHGRKFTNVAFRIYLREVNSEFHVDRHYRCEALCFILSDIT